MSGNFDVVPCGKLATADALLTHAMQLLRNEAETLVECHSYLRTVGAEQEPVPGTVCTPAQDHVAEYVELLRDIEAHLGGAATVGADWFADLLARRGEWAEAGL